MFVGTPLWGRPGSEPLPPDDDWWVTDGCGDSGRAADEPQSGDNILAYGEAGRAAVAIGNRNQYPPPAMPLGMALTIKAVACLFILACGTIISAVDGRAQKN